MFSWLTGILYGLVTLMGWGALWRSLFRVETSPQEIHFATTEDGWRIALSRYHDHDDTIVRKHPVILCHGLASNGTTFDMSEDLSFARHLAADGWDVWVLELRGHGYSQRPKWWTGRRYGWSFDHYLTQDMPAAIDYVLDYTDSTQVHWLGHSMGGVLLYSYLATEGGQRIRSGITVASGLDYSHSGTGFHGLNKARHILKLLPAAPYGALMVWLSPFVGWLNNRLEQFLYWPSNTEGSIMRKIHANNFHTISTPVLHQLATVLDPGGLRSTDDSVRYIDGLADITTPVFALAGDKDAQCDPSVVLHTIDAMPQAECKMQVFGKEFGQTEHYGHFDLLLGKHVYEETFPIIQEWLEEYDS